MKPLILSFLIIAVFTSIAAVLSVFGVDEILDIPSQPDTKIVLLGKDSYQTQSFKSQYDGLSLIRIYLKNTRLLNQDLLVFKLYDQKQNLLRTINLNGYNIGDGEFIRFQFPSIVDSKDQTFYFELITPDTEITDNPLGVGWAQNPDQISYSTYFTPQNPLTSLRSFISRISLSKFNNQNITISLFSALIIYGLIKYLKI